MSAGGGGIRQRLARDYRTAVDRVAETDVDAAVAIEEYVLHQADRMVAIRKRLREAEAAAGIQPPGSVTPSA